MANGSYQPADPFRRQYRELTEAEKQKINNIKRTAAELYDQLDARFGETLPDPRAMAIARTKLEESVMWATKSITG